MPCFLRGRLGPLVLCCMSGSVLAAENLPPLRVDPALLGPVAPRAPAAPTPVVPEAAPESPPQVVAPAPAPPPAPVAPPEADLRRAPRGETETPPAERPRAAPPPRPRAQRESKPPIAAPATPPAEPRATPAPPPVPQAAERAPLRVEPELTPRAGAPETPAAPAVPATPPTESLDVLPQEREDIPPQRLRLATELHPLPKDPNIEYPTYLTADRITGRTDDETHAEGNAEVRKGTTIVNADRLTRWERTDEVEAEGHVRLQQNADVIEGPKMRLRMTDNIGYFEHPRYSITRFAPQTKSNLPPSLWETPPAPGPHLATVPVIAGEVTVDKSKLITGTGVADRIDFQGENRYHLDNATYSTCRADDPEWYAQVRDLTLDYNAEVGEGRDGKVIFKGVPIMYSPWLDFSLSDKRKSGFLPPTVGSSTTSGFEATVPYYWNIAPNMDATIAPRVMSRRGVQLNTEYRYLDYNYKGRARVEFLPSDQLRNGDNRYAYSLIHNHNLGGGFSGSLNLNNVSDPQYFRDMSTRVSLTSQALLLNQGVLSYGSTWWSATANLQHYKVLQDPAQPRVTIPYDRLPQLTFTGAKPDYYYGSAFYLNGEYVRFDHPDLVNGQRAIAYPQLALPLQTSAYYVTPKIGYHVTRYNLSGQAAGQPDTITRTLPILSVDSGVAFERDTSWAGRSFVQTLEPRLYYLYVPTRDQSNIPVFDTALADLNFATIFSENIYAGGDRIADANQLTAALTTRFIDPSTGAEFVRAAIGQRYYFKDQEVTLPGERPRTGRSADILAAVSGEVLPRVYADLGVQYNPRQNQTERLVVGGRYQPGPTQVLNASYRFTRDVLSQIDVSAQWPLRRGWYGVGRYNFSFKEARVIEVIGGLEYNAGCWATRFVLHRIATTPDHSSTAFFVQLELNGLGRLGSNPLDMLKRNIPGYGIINRSTADPAFGAE